MTSSTAPVCANHPDIDSTQVCGNCGRDFCGDCLVPLHGMILCGVCKVLSLRDVQRRSLVQDRLAHEALMYALVGVLCAVIMEPIALAKALEARKRHRNDPYWPDRWKATTAIVVSSLLIFVFLLSLGVEALMTYGAGGR